MLHDGWDGPHHVGSCDGSTAHLAEAGESAASAFLGGDESGNIMGFAANSCCICIYIYTYIYIYLYVSYIWIMNIINIYQYGL